nr:hypothetical protein [Olsenella sp. DNF00959]
MHVGGHIGVACALGGEVRCRADAVVLEPRERLGEPFELREVAKLNGGTRELCSPALACVRDVPCRSQREAAHERLAPVAETQALARDAPGGVPGKREHPVAPACLGGVVLDLHAQALEEPPELVFAPRDGACNADAGADVRHPGVATLLGDLTLRAAHVLGLQRAGTHAPACGSPLLGAVEVREPAFLGHALQGMLELLGVGVLKAASRGDVGVVHDHVGVRDAPGVVVVVDDGDLVVDEVLARPGDRELAEGVQPHVVLGVRREHVVLVGAAGSASPGRVVSPASACAVHCCRPVEGGVLALGDIEVQVVGGEGPFVLGEVAVDAPAGRVTGYGLE